MSSQVPRYLRQRRRGKSDSALVVIDGKRHHLGVFNSAESLAKYAELIGTPNSIGGAITSNGDGEASLEILLPIGLRSATFTVTIKDGEAAAFTRDGDYVRVVVPVRANERVPWAVTGLGG